MELVMVFAAMEQRPFLAVALDYIQALRLRAFHMSTKSGVACLCLRQHVKVRPCVCGLATASQSQALALAGSSSMKVQAAR